MINNDLIPFLGRPVSEVLGVKPYKDWPYIKSRDEDMPIFMANVHFEFKSHGLALSCNASEILTTVFLFAEGFGDVEADEEIVFAKSRDDIRARYGEPTKSGAAHYDSSLGKIGAWDRFDMTDYCLHFEFFSDRDAVKQITMMTLEVAP
jgi:hypothetical protein